MKKEYVIAGVCILALAALGYFIVTSKKKSTYVQSSTTNTSTNTPTKTTTDNTTANSNLSSYTVAISQNTYDSCGVGNSANVKNIIVMDDGSDFTHTKYLTSNDLVNYNGIYAVSYNNQYITVQCNGTNTATALSSVIQCPISSGSASVGLAASDAAYKQSIDAQKNLSFL
jgi:hypothetical protein